MIVDGDLIARTMNLTVVTGGTGELVVDTASINSDADTRFWSLTSCSDHLGFWHVTCGEVEATELVLPLVLAILAVVDRVTR